MSSDLYFMLGIVCGFIAFIISVEKDYSMFGCAGIMLILMICVLLLSTFLFPFDIRDKRKSELLQTSVSIYSLKKTSGHYTFFVRKNGGFIPKEVPIKQTLIIEKNTPPSIITNQIVNIRYYNKSNGVEIKRDTLDYSQKTNAFVLPIKNDLGYKYIITMPKGSIMDTK